MTPTRAWRVWGALLAGLLVGCEEGGVPTRGPATPWAISALLPNPVEAGGMLTVLGTLPPQAQVEVAGQRLALTPVAGGGRFTLPRGVWAGLHTLTVQGPNSEEQAQASVQVRPRITGAQVQGQILTLRGLGWLRAGTLPPQTRVRVDQAVLVPSLDGDALRVVLQDAGVYGDRSVQVEVAGTLGAAYTLRHRAATVLGQVGTAPPAAPAARVASALPAPAAAVGVIVHLRSPDQVVPGLSALPGLHSQRRLRGFAALRLEFASVAQARTAIVLLRQEAGLAGVEFDSPIGLQDGQQAIPTGEDGPGDQWFWPLLGVPAVWPRTQGEGVTVAVLDTGVLSTHPDLRGALLPGWDFVDQDDQPQDTVGHGTHVAGLIAASGQVRGAAPRARVLPVRVLRSEGGDSSSVAEGLLWAAGLLDDPPNPHPAQIINLSLGSPNASVLLNEAVRRVLERGVLVVAATGNSGAGLAYPAALPGVVAVTALAGPRTPYQPAYANRGLGVTLAGYGGERGVDRDGNGIEDGVLSTDLVGGVPGHSLRAGTSMAAPQVSGIAALLLSGGVPARELRATLERTALDFGPPGYDLATGYGLVRADAATGQVARTYVLAVEAGQVRAWTVPDAANQFTLSNIPPGLPLNIVAVRDDDGDGQLGEPGEARSAPISVNLDPEAVLPLADLLLSSHEAGPSYTLP